MATLVVDSTKSLLIKNPVIKSLKDAEGSPIPLDTPISVDGFKAVIENPLGNFGAMTDKGDGSFEFVPGDEINEQASGDFVYSGTFVYNGETKNATGRLSVELKPGAPESGEIEPELEVE